MALNIVVKNTFLDVDESDGACGSSRRSFSVPSAWKPKCVFDRSCRQGSSLSVVSTAPSDADSNDGQGVDDLVFPLPTPKKTVSLNPEAAVFQMPPNSPAPAMKPSNNIGSSMIRLNPEAPAFEPTPSAQGGTSLPTEIHTVISAAKQALLGSPSVVDVKVAEGSLGQTTTVVAEVHSTLGPFGSHEILQLAKAALLGAAARSQITYVLGYFEAPFQDMCDSGFRAVIGSIPTNMQDSICWDTYQRGFCPRRSLCRWCHPLETDLAPLHVILKRRQTTDLERLQEK